MRALTGEQGCGEGKRWSESCTVRTTAGLGCLAPAEMPAAATPPPAQPRYRNQQASLPKDWAHRKEGTAIGSIARGKNTAELLSARLRGGIRVPTPPPSCLCAPCTHHHDVPGYRCLRRYGWLGLRRALRVVVQGPLQHLFRECVVFAKLSLPCELVPDK